MQDKWSQYETATADKWSQFETPPAGNLARLPEEKGGLIHRAGEWAKGEAERRQSEELSLAARGKGSPLRAGLRAFAPNVLSDVAKGVEALGTKSNLAMTAASLHPAGRAVLSPYIAGTSAIGALEAKPRLKYVGIKERPETLGFEANPEETQKRLLNLAGVAGGAAGVREAAPKVMSRFAGVGQKLSRKMYQSALKPPPGSNTRQEVSRMVETGLKEGISISDAGVNKLSKLVTDLQSQVTAEIALNPNAPISPGRVASRLAGTKERFAQQVAPKEDLATIASTKREFLGAHEQPSGKTAPRLMQRETSEGKPYTEWGDVPVMEERPIPAAEAQRLKTGTYIQLKDRAYGELKTARVEAEKALARGLKEEINEIFPKLKGLNAREAELYNLQPELERAIRRIGNHDILSLSTYGAATVGGLAMGESALAGAGVTGFLVRVLGDPAVKSRLAIALDRASGKIGKLGQPRSRLQPTGRLGARP